MWFLEGDEVNHSYLKPDEAKLVTVSDVIDWNPDAVFVPGNVVPSFIPGLKVAVFHGFNAGKVNRRGRLDHFEIRGCFDLYCTQGPETTIPFLELAKKHEYFDVVETGWPALDPLFSEDSDNLYVDEKDERPTILMCSTFSRSLSCAPVLFSKIRELSQLGDWRWLIQFHPKMPRSIVEQYKSLQNENLTFVETDDVIPLLKSADVMLCDTSSILLMFLILKKPVVTFRNQKPAPHLLNVINVSEVENMLHQALSGSDTHRKEIEKYVNYIHPYGDGKSSERVVSAVEDILNSDRKKNKPRKPFNLIRHLKIRKKLNYWKF